MAFVNEYIPEVDMKKHKINSDLTIYRAGANQWTVDRDRNMFLVHRASFGPDGPPGEESWAFQWQEKLLDVRIKNLGNKVDDEGNVLARKIVLYIQQIQPLIGELPPELELQRPEIIGDLKDALSVYGVAGLLLPIKSYKLELATQ